MNVLLVFAHPFPNRSRLNRSLVDGVRDLPGLVIHDLYEKYPNFLIDVREEQEALLKADIVVFQHPFYWYSCPPLLKQWFDDVLERDFAYGPDGTSLQGKYWMHAISTGGPHTAYTRTGYNHFSMHELIRPFEQSAYLCGMIPLEPFISHHATRIEDSVIKKQTQTYRELIANIQKGQLPPAHNTK